MTDIPIILDTRPPYLGASDDDVATSTLLLPTGRATVLNEIVEHLATLTPHPPFVLPAFEVSPRYVEALRRDAPQIAGIVGPEVFDDPLARFDPSDAILLIASACYPIDGLDLTRLIGLRGREPRMLRHLLAYEADPLGSKEFVQAGADGRPRRIQRYFEPMTWTTPNGILASLVPVASLLMTTGTGATTLPELRGALSAQGLPSEDVIYHGRLVDLSDEMGALALAERRLLSLVRGATPPSADPGGVSARPVVLSPTVRLDPSARFVGPVVIAGGVCVEADALVVGPTLLGHGAHVGRGATVAQCLLVGGSRVDPERRVRHRVVSNATRAGADVSAPRRQTLGGTPTHLPAIRQSPYLMARAVAEPVIAFTALVLLLPLFLAFVILIVLDSGLPAFYGDRREGRGGVPFRCWKFRSMRVDAAAMQRSLAATQQLDGPQFKMDRDPRVTRVGRWLRRLNVDELPQLWNVLRGQMSFVGPRPSPFRENQICIPWRNGRLSVRPGITGLWQVCRHDRAAGDFHQWIHYDLLYVRHVSFRVDVRIALATLLTLGGRRPTPVERMLPDARGHRPLRGGDAREAAGEAPGVPAGRADLRLEPRQTPQRPTRLRTSREA